MTRTLKINEDFKNLIPPLSDEEMAELRESLLQYGCRDAIVIWNDTIIDGHNRYRICTEQGLPFKVEDMTFDFDNEDEVKAWIIRNQFARRNIDKYQRAQLALQLKAIIAGKDKENQGTRTDLSTNNICQISDKCENTKNDVTVCQKSDNLENEEKSLEPIDTKKELAKLAGISHDTIQRVETIETKAPEPLRQAARDNVISINKAYEITKEVQALPENERESEALRLMNERTEKKNKEIEHRYHMAKSFAKAVESIGTYHPSEEALSCYIEYSPKEMTDDLIKMCNNGVEALNQLKALYQQIQKPKVVK